MPTSTLGSAPDVPVRLSVTLLTVLALVVGAAPSRAQGDAQAALDRGDYAQARTLLTERIQGGETEHAVALAHAYLAPGLYPEGLAAVDRLLARNREDAYLLHARGRLLTAVGRYDEAADAFRRAARLQGFHANSLALAELLALRGRKREAFGLYGTIFRAYQQGTFRTAELLTYAGRAGAALEDFHEANSAFRLAYELAPTRPRTLFAWAEVFRDKYNTADAQRTYGEALELNPSWADLYVGFARSLGSFERKERLAQEALQHNPNHVGALALLAGLSILDGRYDEAGGRAERALAVNPNSLEALAQLASVHYLRGDAAAFARVEARAAEVNPNAGQFYLDIADNLALRFRYPDAAAMNRRAIEAERDNVDAYAAYGTSLLRLGEVREARRYLDAAYERDAFNLFVGNTLTLLDSYQDFRVLEGPNVRLLIHQSEADVLGPAMLAEAEAAFEAFAARYPYRPEGKLLVEAYHDASDFGVRIAGVPHLGLLGVAFGDVVALNTPRAQPGGRYNWARTLWHELAHTFAIGTSGHRVPRWLTEGLAVYEEKQARPEWGREMELEFFTVYDRGELLPLREIDRGFTRPQFPGQVLLSYFHASKVIDYVADTFGFEAVVGVLEALREGASVDAAFQQATGQDLAALDEGFRARLAGERQTLAEALEGVPDLLSDEGASEKVVEQLSGEAANPFFRRLVQAHDAARAGDADRAERLFQEALDLYDGFTAPGNPYEGLAALYRDRGDPARLADILARYLAVAEHGAPQARELAGLLAERDPARAAAYLRRSLDVDPYDLETHVALAGLYAEQQQHALAARQYRAALALDPVDRAGLYYRLARSLRASGEVAAAKRAVLQSLEVAPGFREAQTLLLQIVDAGS